MNTTRSDYRGYRITTKWFELGPPPNRTAARFDACFKVVPDARQDEPWQEFPADVFGTHEGAVANALTKAQQSIDRALAFAMMPAAFRVPW